MTDPQPETAPKTAPKTAPNSASLKVNLATSLIFLLLSLWMLIADIRFPIDMLFQSSPSILLLALFTGLWFFVALITSIFPKRIVLAAALLATLRVSFGWPLNFIMANTPACQVISILTFLLAAYYLLSTFKRWLLISYRPWFRWQHSILMFIVWSVFSVVALIPMALGILQGLDNFAGNYVDVSIKGVSLKEKVFEKDGKRIRLTGMVHIADPDFYQNLTHRLENSATGRHLVLTEGVSDKLGLLPESFATGQTYAKFADELGLKPQNKPLAEPKQKQTSQPIKEIRGFTYMNADSDISDLSQKHQKILIELLTFIDQAEPIELLTMPEGITELDIHDLFMNGLLKGRNDHLMQVFNEQLPAYDEIHMPWGAAHLPDIEERLLNQGYIVVEETDQPAINFLKRFQ